MRISTMQTNVEPLGLEAITILAVIPLFATFLAILCCHNTTRLPQAQSCSSTTSTSDVLTVQQAGNPFLLSPTVATSSSTPCRCLCSEGHQLNEAENLHEGESLGTNVPSPWLAFNNLKDIFMQVIAMKTALESNQSSANNNNTRRAAQTNDNTVPIRHPP